MFKTFATNVVVSKGREGAAALKFSENGEFVRFRIGQKVYDSRVEGNYRWLNISVKAFGTVCERIKKMKLKEGSFVNLTARLDEEKWTDQETKKSQHVLIVEDIEYAYVGKSGENQNASQNQSQGQNQAAGQYQQAAPAGAAPANRGQVPAANPAATQPAPEPQAADPMESDGFMGFEAFGGNNLFQD